jgi:hypothetical protein
MPVPTIYPGSYRVVGSAREAVTGTPVLPTLTMPCDTFDPTDDITWLDDGALRGSMTDLYNSQGGPQMSGLSMGGPVVGDSIGNLLWNVFGDYTVTGTPAAPNTTLTGASNTAGAVALTVAVGTGVTLGMAIQVGTGTSAEIVIASGAGTSTSIPIANTPLRFNHAAAEAVTNTAAPYTHVFSLLNSALNGAQPPSWTFADRTGVPTNGARVYAYSCLAELVFSWDGTKLWTWTAKATAWPSAPAASAPSNVLPSALPIPSWQAAVGIAGPASGGTKVLNVSAFTTTISRKITAYDTLDGTAAPFVIVRGDLSISGSLTQVATDETPITNLIGNTQPQLQLLHSNGLSGANLVSGQLDILKARYKTSDIKQGDALTYDTAWDAIANTTNVGNSGGQSPGKFTLVNAVPSY